MRVTINDVAEHAGLSASLVSSILQGGSSNIGYTEESRHRVLRAARKLKYKSKTTNRIGVVYATGEHHPERTDWVGWISPYLTSIHTEAIKCDKLLSVFGYSAAQLDDLLGASKGPQIFKRRNIDGMIISGIMQPSLLNFVTGNNLPHVLMNVSDAHTHARDAVSFDEVFTGHQATRHLLEKGHERILHISVNWSGRHYSIAGRKAGYEQTMNEANLPARTIQHREHTRMGHPTPEYLQELRAILTSPDHPTAIFTYDETVAVCCREVLVELGVSNEIPMITAGVQNIRFMELMGISVVELPTFEMGRMALRMLLEKLETSLSAPSIALRGFVRENTPR
jgi:LacI family transcriptional regulator